MNTAFNFCFQFQLAPLHQGIDADRLGDPRRAGSTALDIARLHTKHDCLGRDFAETLAVLRRMCCSSCGVTSAGLSAAAPGAAGGQHLRRCSSCPARGPSAAHYCGTQCQRADWVARHRGECAEAQRARQAAGTD